jgi:hypothetical protein
MILNVAYVSALSALGGSVIGGLMSGFSTWLSLREQTLAGKRIHDQERLEELYKDFINSASKAHGDALTSNDPCLPDIVALYATIARIRMIAPQRIVACADKVMVVTMSTYFAPSKKKTLKEIHEMLEKGQDGLDLLKEFSEVAREERDRSRSRGVT